MSTTAASSASTAENTDGFDSIGAAVQMADTGEGILIITGMCSDVRRRMVEEQGWPPDFADKFSQELVGLTVGSVFQQSTGVGANFSVDL